ncbi:deoxyribodipyrimidine photo-lyase [Hyphomicrobium sp.]|uniref:cryptochrome/photolyase family protein n=1 Tax=Hyphomicrobium sp. TaxID=82 RepID=UPI001D6A8346|nr:deoxyribodipyrimidine photo-lyase [Hyphomicrobium sp.]MBY0559108.1 DNA photolyase family protein [Hyphomicrobium sp.]
MSSAPVIVWLRNDFRLRDHPALTAAVASGSPVIPLYVLDDETPGRWVLGGASRWWLGKTIEAFARDIAACGGKLVLCRGDVARELVRVVEETGATAVYFSRSYEPSTIALEDQLKAAFDDMGVAFKRYGGRLLRQPEETRTKSGGPYQVFTPFWRAFTKDLTLPRALAAPDRIKAPSRSPKSDDLRDWQLSPTKPDWSRGLGDTWQPGESGARDRLAEFAKTGLATYAIDRDRLDEDGTSRLSPHLAFGEISPAACWRAAADAARGKSANDQSIETFMRELVWREFSYSLLFHFPKLPEEPLRPEFAEFPWLGDAGQLRAWQRGKTGYPIVDAGMRELWATGYMHNRARMIVASFLVKHLLIPWTAGEAWFWDTLVDADLANNSASWQWVAGCGADAAPYFRIFNPVLQGEKFDPNGEYVRRWVPELAGLTADVIHKPWTAKPESLAQAGVVLGKSYPRPLVEHAYARVRALQAYEKIKTASKKENRD